MNLKNLFWGLLFVCVGVLWLLHYYAIINISCSDLIALWPLILIWIGIAILPIKEWVKFILKILALSLGIVLLLSCNPRSKCHHYYYYPALEEITEEITEEIEEVTKEIEEVTEAIFTDFTDNL